MKWLGKYADYAYALLRLVTGFIFSFHGAQKILGVLSEFQPPAWSQLWFGGIIELVGGLMVLLGYQARAAAFLCSGTMAVASGRVAVYGSPITVTVSGPEGEFCPRT